MNTQQNIIYGRFDPRNDALRYIGKSTSGMRRPMQHQRESYILKYETGYTSNWLKQLLSFGLKPRIEVLDWTDDPTKLSDMEIRYIAQHRAMGTALTNATEGGEGLLGRRHSLETKEKCRQAKIGNKFNLGRKQTDEEIENRAQVLRGKTREPDVSFRIRETSIQNQGKRVVDSNGVEFRSIGEAARSYGVKKQIVQAVLSGKTRAFRGVSFSFVGQPVHTWKKKNGRRRSVVDSTGVVYPSIAEAAKTLCIAASSISRVIAGGRPSCAGRTFSYVEVKDGP